MRNLLFATPMSKAAIDRAGLWPAVEILMEQHGGVWKRQPSGSSRPLERFPFLARSRLLEKTREPDVSEVCRWRNVGTSVSYDKAADVVWFRLMFDYAESAEAA